MSNERRSFKSGRESREDRYGERHGGRDTSAHVMYDAECEQCHAVFQVPFEPEPGRTILCRNCLRLSRGRDESPRHGRERGQSGNREHNDRNHASRHGREPREVQQYDIVCSHCGKAATVPFKPYEGSAVLCQACMNNPNVSRVGGRILHTIICAVCGRENKVPFMPDPGSRVLCRECHKAEQEKKQRLREYYGKHHPSVVNHTKVRIEITCDKCGNTDSLPFVPKTHGAILCRKCAEQMFGAAWAKRNRMGVKEHPFTCIRCGAEDFVPFKPVEGHELLCKHCLNDQAVLRHNDGKTHFTNGLCIRTRDKASTDEACACASVTEPSE